MPNFLAKDVGPPTWLPQGVPYHLKDLYALGSCSKAVIRLVRNRLGLKLTKLLTIMLCVSSLFR